MSGVENGNEGGLEEFSKQAMSLQPRTSQSWVNIDGAPDREGGRKFNVDWRDVLISEVVPQLETIKLRNPDEFMAGGLHKNVSAWEAILSHHPFAEKILEWIRKNVDILQFSRPFTGSYKGSHYGSDLPPTRRFINHGSCKKFSEFISQEILKRLITGAFRVWGRVGASAPPHLILPLTVEPTKPRLCLDARFLNLWMKDTPFTLDKLADVPRYVYKDSFLTKCDDKSGYDHVLLTESSQTYFGFEWREFWFVCTTLPFGWKVSPYIYHTTGLAVSGFLREQGVPCSLYIDDRLNGELLTKCRPWSVLYSNKPEELRAKAAKAAIFIVLSILLELGYTIGISKSVLCPTTSLEYLGFVIDSKKQSFMIPQRKIVAWASLREKILACKKYVDVKTLQRFQGKCISVSLAVPAAKLFIREMSYAIASTPTSGLVSLSQGLRDELIHWRFLDTWEECVPWRDEKHLRLTVSTEASGYGWGGIIHKSSGDRALGDYWDEYQKSLNISTKEMLALVNTIKAAPGDVRDCRVDAFVDSRVLIGAWEGQGSRSPELTRATMDLFFVLAARNVQLNLFHVPSEENSADGPSRRISRSDSKLAKGAWERVEQAFGGITGHSFDLMALDSNAVIGRDGDQLPHFSPHPSPGSQGVNLFCQNLEEMDNMSNPYVFPPFGLLGPVFKFLYGFAIPFTVVVPEFHPHAYWWPELMAHSSAKVCLGVQGDMDVLLAPSKSGYKTIPCPVLLWACRVSWF